jgi:hypothetical protein
MRELKRKEDPTGFLNLFRHAAALAFGDPSGFVRGRGRWPHHRKAGPGRRPAGPWNPTKRQPATGAGSINCEAEIRTLIEQGRREEAIKLYEANLRVYFTAGRNPGLPRLKRWYELAKAGDGRAA